MMSAWGSTGRGAAAAAGRVRRLLRGVAALIMLVAVVAGVPVLMSALHLVPHSVPSPHQVGAALTHRDDGHLVGILLAAGVWLCWLLFTVSLLPELAGLVRKRPAKPLPGLGVFQRPAAGLVSALAIGFALAPLAAGVVSAAHANAAGPAPVPAPHSSTSSLRTTSPASPPSTLSETSAAIADRTEAATARAAISARPRPCYEVHRHDTLWGIAERYLDNPLRYPEIAQLNASMIGPDNEIRPGALLTLPADATGPGLLHRRADGELGDDTTTVRVKPGDTLYGIEERVTGDGDNWSEGFAANEGRIEPGGERFTDPDLIKPGWTLSIPAASSPASPHATSSPRSAPARGQPGTDASKPPHRPAPPASGSDRPAPESTPSAANSPAPARTAPVPIAPQTREPGAVGRSHHQPSQGRSTDRSSETAVLAFTGGGTLLAGLSLTALMYYRRSQFRRRRPGYTIGNTPPNLIQMERAVLSGGKAGVGAADWLDRALRGLVQTAADRPDGHLPDVIAVRVTSHELTLILTGPDTDLHAPWQASHDATRWSIGRDDVLPYDPERRDRYFAPYPTLTSVGYTDSGEQWLLDLERIGALSLAGDADRCLDLARFLAAELAHNTWSEMLRLILVGFGEELVAANPDRLAYTDDFAAATALLAGRLEETTTAMRALNTDVLDGRLRDIVGDQWAPTVLLVAPQAAADSAALDELLADLQRRQARAAVALVLADDPGRAAAASWQLTVDSCGTLRVPALGLELTAQQIAADEAAALAQLLACAAVSDDEPIPPAAGDQPWDAYADACGGLTVAADEADRGDDLDRGAENGATGARVTNKRAEVTSRTEPNPAGDAAISALHLAGSSSSRINSILPLPAHTYPELAATTAEDVRALAPVVDDSIRGEVERAVGDLDADLAAWVDPDCPRPKLRLLGRLQVWAHGVLPKGSPQEAFHTEAVVYLACRSHGALSTEFAEAMWPNEPDVAGKPKVRQAITAVRRWLSADPTTGQDYLPTGLYDGRIARYVINGLLCDAELFRRLRVRGIARGQDGLDDLWRALSLVTGPPLDGIVLGRECEQPDADRDSGERKRGPGGWLWMVNANQRLDWHYQAMIVDTAHTVADRHNGAGEPERAAQAAQVSLLAGSYDNVPLLDLVNACLALDKDAEAEAYVRQMLLNAGVEREEDLDPRTAEVLFRLRRRWRDRAS